MMNEFHRDIFKSGAAEYSDKNQRVFGYSAFVPFGEKLVGDGEKDGKDGKDSGNDADGFEKIKGFHRCP